jgi:hypothetical protein
MKIIRNEKNFSLWDEILVHKSESCAILRNAWARVFCALKWKMWPRLTRRNLYVKQRSVQECLKETTVRTETTSS